MLRVGGEQHQPGDDPAPERAVAGDGEHCGIDVTQQDLAAAFAQPAEAHVARAARDVEQRVRGPRIERGDKDALPCTVDAERHQVVHQVVARRHAVEDRAHQARLLRFRHAAVAEIGGPGAHRVVAHAGRRIACLPSMPELPEVETVMRGLNARLEGRVIARAEARRPDLRWALPPGLVARLNGARVLGFRRRGKYMLMRLAGGDSVLLHLGMSGRMSITPARPSAPVLPHEHIALETDDGWRIGFVDPRRFGMVDLVRTDAEDEHRLLAGLGPEPLDPAFTSEVLSAALAGKRTPIKAALLDQGIVAGLGNIYVSEALFRAGISPRRLATSVVGERARRLVPAIKETLTEAIAAGGSSLRDYVQPDGALGYFQHAWKVYGREGEKCERCPGPPGCAGVRRIVQSGRATFYCPPTQR